MTEVTGNGINRRQALFAAAGVAAVGVAGSFSSASAQTPEAAGGTLSGDIVLAGLAGALAKATEIGVPSVVAIFDRAGTQLGFVRQEGALVVSNTFAPQKAYTAAAFGAPTADFAAMARSDPTLLASLMKVENVTLLGGGLPIIVDGVPIGGIGASGGSVEQDIEVATAGLAALGFS